MSEMLPLIRGYAADAPLLYTDAGGRSQADGLGAAAALAQRLPQAAHVLNLCEDRGRFLLAFMAACWRGQTSLLPQSRAPGAVREIAGLFPGCYVLADAPFDDVGVPQFHVADADLG